ncbi:MAG TPA: hypothetical protein VLE02_01870 [Nitrosarchaeum sp.]|nr:hypothetical protein [Nitrosarchaeum sp.]
MSYDFDKNVGHWAKNFPYICESHEDVKDDMPSLSRTYIIGDTFSDHIALIHNCGKNPVLKKLCMATKFIDEEMADRFLIRVNGNDIKFPLYKKALFRGVDALSVYKNFIDFICVNPIKDTVQLKYNKINLGPIVEPISWPEPNERVFDLNKSLYYYIRDHIHKFIPVVLGYVLGQENYHLDVEVTPKHNTFEGTPHQQILMTYIYQQSHSALFLRFHHRNIGKHNYTVLIFESATKSVYVFDPQGTTHEYYSTYISFYKQLLHGWFMPEWTVKYEFNRKIGPQSFCERFDQGWCVLFMKLLVKQNTDLNDKLFLNGNLIAHTIKYINMIILQYETDFDAYIYAFSESCIKSTHAILKNFSKSQVQTEYKISTPSIDDVKIYPKPSSQRIISGKKMCHLELSFDKHLSFKEYTQIYMRMLKFLIEHSSVQTKWWENSYNAFVVISERDGSVISTQIVENSLEDKLKALF